MRVLATALLCACIAACASRLHVTSDYAPDLDFEAPRRVVPDGIPNPGGGTSFDIARDGRLIMSNADAGELSADRPVLVVVLGWFEIVEERAPRR